MSRVCKSLILIQMLCVGVLAVSRPSAPEFSGPPSYIQGESNLSKIKVTITSSALSQGNKSKIHVLCMPEFTTSLDQLYKQATKVDNGSNFGNGPVLAYDEDFLSNSQEITVPLSDSCKGNYFIATAVSNIENGVRVFSAWKVWPKC